MHITLIGMSNIGKSHWSKRLAKEAGYERVGCDNLIEQKLAPELVKQGYAGIRDVAKWMGQPYEPQHRETSAKYSACERSVMEDIIARMKAPDTKPLVIDSTGSVIYTGDDIAEQLRALTRIVYLEASPAHVEQLFERYLASPKPVIWGNAYASQPGEAPQDALKRCYPKLLQSGATRYAEIAHVTIPYEQHYGRKTDFSALIGAA